MQVFYRVSAIVTTVGFLLGTAACSSNTKNNSPGQGPNQNTADAGPNTILIQDFKYVPDNIVVSPGTTLRVVNMDSEAHSVTSESKIGNFSLGAVQGIQFDTGLIDQDVDATFTIPQASTPGTIVPYFCTVHKSTMMEGRVTIQ